MSFHDRLQKASSLNTVKVHLLKLMAKNVLCLPQLPPAGIYHTFLETTYKTLEGKTFPAKYTGSRLMPQTRNFRDILVVAAQNPLAVTLQVLMSSVVAQCGEMVWKGVTSTFWGDVWLWVEPTFAGTINVNSIHEFKIEKTTVFPCYPGTNFPHGGVSIRAGLLIPQIPTIQVPQMGTQLRFPRGM